MRGEKTKKKRERERHEADTDRGSRLLLGNSGRSGESRKRGDSVTESQPGRSAYHLGMLIKIVLMSVSNQMALSRAFLKKKFLCLFTDFVVLSRMKTMHVGARLLLYTGRMRYSHCCNPGSSGVFTLSLPSLPFNQPQSAYSLPGCADPDRISS